jgi:hypothetical protein
MNFAFKESVILDSYFTQRIFRREQQKLLLIIFADKINAVVWVFACACLCRARQEVATSRLPTQIKS